MARDAHILLQAAADQARGQWRVAERGQLTLPPAERVADERAQRPLGRPAEDRRQLGAAARHDQVAVPGQRVTARVLAGVDGVEVLLEEILAA